MLGAEVAPEPIYFGIKQIGEIIISILFSDVSQEDPN